MKLKQYVLQDLEDEPYLLAIDGKVYDMKEFCKVHPGGQELLYYCGRDATRHYRSIHAGHAPERVHRVLKEYQVGEILKDAPKVTCINVNIISIIFF